MPRPADALPDEQYALSKSRYALTEARVTLAMECLKAGKSRSAIKKALQERFGIKYRAANDIITEAWKRIGQELAGDPEGVRADNLAFYRTIGEINEQFPRGTKNWFEAIRMALRARERLDSVLGLTAPQQHQISVSVSLDDVVKDIERRRRGDVLDVAPLPAVLEPDMARRRKPDDPVPLPGPELPFPPPHKEGDLLFQELETTEDLERWSKETVERMKAGEPVKPAPPPKPKPTTVEKLKATIAAKVAQPAPPKPKPYSQQGPVSWDDGEWDADLVDD